MLETRKKMFAFFCMILKIIIWLYLSCERMSAFRFTTGFIYIIKMTSRLLSVSDNPCCFLNKHSRHSEFCPEFSFPRPHSPSSLVWGLNSHLTRPGSACPVNPLHPILLVSLKKKKITHLPEKLFTTNPNNF